MQVVSSDDIFVQGQAVVSLNLTHMSMLVVSHQPDGDQRESHHWRKVDQKNVLQTIQWHPGNYVVKVSEEQVSDDAVLLQ